MTVTGRREGEAANPGFVPTNTATATKTDTPLIETPQSVSVVTREQIAEQGAQTLNQVLRYTPGVATETRGATATRLDQFSVRGFSASTYLDGLRVFGGRDALPQVDAYRLERVDVLKGPASVMYLSLIHIFKACTRLLPLLSAKREARVAEGFPAS